MSILGSQITVVLFPDTDIEINTNITNAVDSCLLFCAGVHHGIPADWDTYESNT